MNTSNEQDNFMVSLRILNQIGASILSELTIEQMIDTVYHHVNQLMDAYSFAIGIYNPNTKRIEYTGSRENNIVLPRFSIDAHSPGRFSGWVFIHQKPIMINDYEKEYRQYIPNSIKPMQGIEPASLMYMPIHINGELAGILSVRTPVRNAYSPQNLEILRTLSVFIGKALENSRSLQKGATTPLSKSYALDPLSARELEVLSLLSKGYTNRDIGTSLFISPSTVKTHTLNIYQKLEAANRTQAIIKAKAYGLIV